MGTKRSDMAPEVTDGPLGEAERTERAWPYWMMRYVGSDDRQAMEDLIWSVGGSPPYGGVSWEEAEAVYELLEAYRGPGAADEAHYDKVRATIPSRPDRLVVLDIFHCADQIQSRPDSYGREPVDRGLALARQVGHRGAEATFLSFEAGWLFRAGDVAAAADRTVQALEAFLELADGDPVYEKRVEQSAQNAVGLTARSGDEARARELLQHLVHVLEPDVAEQLRRGLRTHR
jgi:hypothetical protein